MDLFTFMQDRYYKEIERKNILESRTQHHLGIWIVLMSGFIYCLNKVWDLEVTSLYMIMVWIFIGVTFIFLCVTLVFLWQCFKGKYFPYYGKAESGQYSYYETLCDTYKDYPGLKLEEKYFEEFLIKKLVKMVDDAVSYNEYKTDKLIRTVRYSLIASIFLACSFTLIFIGLKNSNDDIKIDVIEHRNSSVKIESDKDKILIDNDDFLIKLFNVKGE